MEMQVDERRALVQNSKGVDLGRDSFTALVQANEDEAAKYKLDKQELVRVLSLWSAIRRLFSLDWKHLRSAHRWTWCGPPFPILPLLRSTRNDCDIACRHNCFFGSVS